MLSGTKWKASLRPLTHRNFRLVWTGSAISSVGNGMFTVILPWTAYRLDGSAALMAIVLVANDIPQIALMLFGGVIGDRYSRRLVVMTSDCLAGIVTAVLAITTVVHTLTPGALIIGSFLLGVGQASYVPAYSALTQDLVPPENLSAANALRGSTSSMAMMAGPALGGIVFAVGGSALGFGLDAASFAIAIFTLWQVKLPKAAVAFEGTVMREVAEGLRYVWRSNWLRTVILLDLITNTLCIAPLFVLLPLIIRTSGYPASFLGITLTTEVGISAASALLLGRYNDKFRPGWTLCGLTAVMGIGACVIGLLPGSRVLILLGACLVGIGFASEVTEDTLLQSQVPGEYLSRVFSTITVAAYSLLPLGYLLAGVLARAVGPDRVLLGGGGAVVAVGVTGLFSRTIKSIRIERPREPAAEEGATQMLDFRETADS
jgi:MFS family permease